MEKLRAVQREGLKTDIPAFAPGDTVRVMVRVREGEKERLQAFEGICIARRGGGINETFTVRKISAGVGVERIFPLHAPLIAEIGILRKGRVRRAKLYFLRRLAGKAARIREKRGITVPTAGTAEVGRGPLAGPVVAAAVVFPMGAKPIRGLDDSKVLSALQRDKFAAKIRERAFAIAVGAASVREIDRLNIRRASILAMARALRRLGFVPAHVLVDG